MCQRLPFLTEQQTNLRLTMTATLQVVGQFSIAMYSGEKSHCQGKPYCLKRKLFLRKSKIYKVSTCNPQVAFIFIKQDQYSIAYA